MGNNMVMSRFVDAKSTSQKFSSGDVSAFGANKDYKKQAVILVVGTSQLKDITLCFVLIVVQHRVDL